MLEPEIIIFANSYKCPLDKRCSDCVFNNLTNIPIHQIYHEIRALEPEDRCALVAECESCQRNYSMNAVE